MKKITKKELGIILKEHSLWLKGKDEGRKADLSDTTLMFADLSDTNLMFADLSNANLSGAYLAHTNLSHANLKGTKLTGANLSYTDLTHALHSYDKLKSISGLRYNITILNDKVTVGCQSHTYKEWLAFGNEEISSMDIDALLFYHVHLVPIIKAEYKEELK